MKLGAWIGLLGASALAACGATEENKAPAGVAAGDAGVTLSGTLGLSDLTVLAPLPSSEKKPILLRASDRADDGNVLLPREHFDSLTIGEVEAIPGSMPIVSADQYDVLHVVAVRLDLCDRNLPGRCDVKADGRLRLVFQPIGVDGAADDVGFHAFYEIPNAELTAAVDEFRALARTDKVGSQGPLRVSPALSRGSSPYADALRAILRRRASAARLTRVTINAQPITAAAIRWVLRGVERKDGAFVKMSIPGSSLDVQSVVLVGATDEPSYQVTPEVDVPAGLNKTLLAKNFVAASASEQRDLIDVLTAIENPLKHGADTVSCVGCHTSTVMMPARASVAGVDATSLPSRYSTSLDVSVTAGRSESLSRTLRALGWLGREPLISRRVANDTAQVLIEVEQRFPAN